MPKPPDRPAWPARKDASLTEAAPDGVLPGTAEPMTRPDSAGVDRTSADRSSADRPGAGVARAGGPGADLPSGDPAADPQTELLNRLRRTPGLEALVAEAVATWRAREGANDESTPGWRAFSDAFPTFWEFSNRPR
jgi:hypothetical protein